jgi:phosphoglycolate phosphatase-like HAD superfamily hydrolase
MKSELSTPIIAEGLPVTFRDQTVWRPPELFPHSYMAEIDFDETCFITFISNGDGIEVHEAYERSLEKVLGPEARQDFSDYNGLSNRAPLDVIEGLIKHDPSLINNALRHAKTYFAHPEDISDIGLGIIARFADRYTIERDELTTRAITEMLVIRKKEQLIPQISPTWPEPLGGFVDVWSDLHSRKSGNINGINWLSPHASRLEQQLVDRWKQFQLAIVSSGHTDFIQKVIATAGLPHPDIYMTDDEMRRQVHPRTKPDPFALQLVRNAWLNAYLVPTKTRQEPGFEIKTKQRQVYIGDDEKKDGKMAANDGIEFILHDGKPDTWYAIGSRIVETVESGKGFNE